LVRRLRTKKLSASAALSFRGLRLEPVIIIAIIIRLIERQNRERLPWLCPWTPLRDPSPDLRYRFALCPRHDKPKF